MRRWLAAARAAATSVADEPLLWLPGALAWLVTVGWFPLVAATWRPSVSGLTYFGSGFFSAGAWPWNAVALAVALVAMATVAFALAAVAESVLVGMLVGRRAGRAEALRLLGVAIVAAAPALALVLLGAAAAVVVAPAEFTAPGGAPGPLARTFLRLLPILAAVVVAASAGAALHAAAGRQLFAGGGTLLDALGAGARRLRRARWPALVHVLAAAVARLAFLAFATLLLIVLWAPIEVRLRSAGADAATVLLLVGFVAVWLCLVLGGGALQAWSSATWTAVLDDRRSVPTMTARREAAPRS
jgi:hypothetical protein